MEGGASFLSGIKCVKKSKKKKKKGGKRKLEREEWMVKPPIIRDTSDIVEPNPTTSLESKNNNTATQPATEAVDLNKLAAKVLKAKMMGDTETQKALEAQLEYEYNKSNSNSTNVSSKSKRAKVKPRETLDAFTGESQKHLPTTNCKLCKLFESNDSIKNLVIIYGTEAMVYVSYYKGQYPVFKIVPREHTRASDIPQVRLYKRILSSILVSTLVFEQSTSDDDGNHSELTIVRLPSDVVADAPLYFKQAMEDTTSFSVDRNQISSSRPRNYNQPFFHVEFEKSDQSQNDGLSFSTPNNNDFGLSVVSEFLDSTAYNIAQVRRAFDEKQSSLL